MRSFTQLVPLLLALGACSPAVVNGDANPPRDVPGDATADLAMTTDIGRTDVPANPADILDLAIEPANPTITSTNGAMTTRAFQLFGVRRDGMRTPLTSGTWSLEHDRLGTISGDGTFTANGVAGGQVTVRAEAAGAGGTVLHAMTMLTVNVRRESAGTGVPADTGMRFADSPVVMDAMRAANVLYPLDAALMPNNVAPPDIQWERGVTGDLFRVRIVKPHLDVTAYLVHSGTAFGNHWLVDRALWRSVAESDLDAAAVITVDRLEVATHQIVTAPAISIRLTHAGIFGAVYYFNFLGSTIAREARINPDTGARVDLIPNPPPAPGSGARCMGCHTVSRDGRYLATALGGSVTGAAVFDLTADLTPDPAPTLFPVDRVANAFFYSFNPDATRLLTANGAGAFALLDPRSGMSVAATGLPTSQATHPEWSPDGMTVAYAAATDLSGDILRHGDLALLPRTGMDAFGVPRLIHRGGDLATSVEGGSADVHPTWSPDSRYIVFGHGPHSYSGNSDVTLTNIQPYPGALYIIARTGGAAIRLDRALGGSAARLSYWPTFSPFITVEPTGGHHYYWLAFGSRRAYGNAEVGTRGTTRLQLWVAAIDLDAPAGSDPSVVPYWLPGQDTATGNFGAFWAAAACRVNGTGCTVSSECCSGRCIADPMMSGSFSCQPPPPADCRRRGQTCGGNADCCTGLTCFGNVCDLPPG